MNQLIISVIQNGEVLPRIKNCFYQLSKVISSKDSILIYSRVLYYYLTIRPVGKNIYYLNCIRYFGICYFNNSQRICTTYTLTAII